MIRTILAAAAALTASALFASGAQACISCEYTPEVARGSSTAKQTPARSYEAKPSKKWRAYSEERKSRPAKSRTVEREPTAKTVETAKAAPATPDAQNENSSISTVAGSEPIVTKTEVASTGPANTESQTENSSISAAAGGEPVATKVETASTAQAEGSSQSENSTITTATLDTSKTADAPEASDVPKVSTNLGCKKFFPTVGLTLSVPCE